jgi:M6 family metalloprotease-like protein
MTRTRWITAAGLAALLLGSVFAKDAPEVAPQPRPHVDLTGYRTAKDAIRANPKEFNSDPAAAAPAAGYLGLIVGDSGGKPVVEAIEPGSPADLAGIREGDQIAAVDGTQYTSPTALRDALRSRLAGDTVKLAIVRQGQVSEVAVTLKSTTRPMSLSGGRPVLGLTPGSTTPEGGVKVVVVSPNGPAEKAGVKEGDVLLRIDGKPIEGDSGVRDALADKRPGDRLDLLLERGGNRVEAKVVLGSDEVQTGARPGSGWDSRLPRAWKKPVYNLAIIGVEYPDVKHSAKVKDSDWEESMFSRSTYTNKSATGEKVYGSMADYYQELSYGNLRVEGKFVGWVEVAKKRNEYNNGVGAGIENRDKLALLTEALDKYVAKNGKDSLKEFDGVFFLYAGEPVPNVARSSLYWPHRASVSFGGRSIPYFIVSELRRGGGMMDISVFCHEFGHMLGLPDLYARPEQPGSEGVWQWCAMSNQIGSGRPQHFCAWSKEQLGWIQPAVIDPRVKQKLILSPIIDDPTQCYKVMLRADGAEYFLLENRVKKGWDTMLPGEGLLIWRVFAGGRGFQQQPVYLEESHGIEGARGPSSLPKMVPFPSEANNSFTPYTQPSSRSQLGGGLSVFITNIRRLPDGRITFHVGYEYQ